MLAGVLRLPKLVEADPRGPELLRALAARRAPLWPGSDIEVPTARLTPALADALRSARSAGQVVRGLEAAEQALAAEQRGLRLADDRGAAPRGERVSRLLLLAGDGAERFYRQVAALLRRHGVRVLAVRLDVDAEALGSLLFGPGRRARLLLLERKQAVASALLAIAAQGDAAAENGAPAPAPDPAR